MEAADLLAARQQRLDLRLIALPPLLERLADLWAPVAAEHHIDVAIESVDGPPPVEADEEKFRRVLDNLVKNAVEAIDRGPGRVGLHVVTPALDRVRIVVEDTGPGVPPTLQMFRLFETTKRDGSGLGLSLAKEIVAAHGGRIGFDPVAPHGAAFYVDLPTRAAVV
jgi:signal transduction histidine kinase